MTTHSDGPFYDPASWSANRSDVGWALLCTVWSSALGGGAFALSDTDESWAGTLAALSGILGLASVVVLTVIGCRLAFGKVIVTPPAPTDGPRTTSARQVSPSLRIIDEPIRKRRSDVQVMTVLTLGIVLAITVVVMIVVILRG